VNDMGLNMCVVYMINNITFNCLIKN